jgi:hypothetical protein
MRKIQLATIKINPYIAFFASAVHEVNKEDRDENLFLFLSLS